MTNFLIIFVCYELIALAISLALLLVMHTVSCLYHSIIAALRASLAPTPEKP
jgi:hypothetical protein